MSGPSPAVTVQDGAGAQSAAPPVKVVTPGNTVTVRLVSTAGVSAFALSIIGTDETTTAGDVPITVDSLTKSATFTAPAAGKALIFEAVVNGGVDQRTVPPTPRADWKQRFKVVTLTAGLKHVIAVNETIEAGDVGWAAAVNDFIRNPVGGAPTGVAGGGLTGTYPNPDVATIAGTAGVATVTATEVAWSDVTRSIKAVTTTTTNAALQTLATIAIPADHVYGFDVRVVARDTGASGGMVATWTNDLFSRRTGTNSGNLERQGSTPTPTVKAYGTLASATIALAVSSNNVLVQGSPGATANVEWGCEIVPILNG